MTQAFFCLFARDFKIYSATELKKENVAITDFWTIQIKLKKLLIMKYMLY